MYITLIAYFSLVLLEEELGAEKDTMKCYTLLTPAVVRTLKVNDYFMFVDYDISLCIQSPDKL